MAKIFEWSPERRAAWDEWVASRPPVVRDLCEKLPMDTLYRLKGGGQRVTLYSYNENGTVTVAVSRLYNLVVFERMVVGVEPDDLEECELPLPDERVGVLFSHEMLSDYLDVAEFVGLTRTSLPTK